MKKSTRLSVISAGLLVATSSISNAALVTIGTAMFVYSDGSPVDGVDYNLIWDNDNNGKSVIWLDYSFFPASQSQQHVNIGSSTASMDITLYSGYSVSWIDPEWRMPSINGDLSYGYDINTTEYGHLFYDEFGFESYPVAGYTSDAQLNSTNFDNLVGAYYLFSEWDAFNDTAWVFAFSNGGKNVIARDGAAYALAIREASVNAVPVPAAAWLFGSGLLGLVAVARRKNPSE